MRETYKAYSYVLLISRFSNNIMIFMHFSAWLFTGSVFVSSVNEINDSRRIQKYKESVRNFCVGYKYIHIYVCSVYPFVYFRRDSIPYEQALITRHVTMYTRFVSLPTQHFEHRTKCQQLNTNRNFLMKDCALRKFSCFSLRTDSCWTVRGDLSS
jgi:hypothetical protein